jgi:oligopeptidase A
MTNPLLSVAHPISFDKIAAEHVPPALTQLVDDAKAAIASIASATAPVSFSNSLGALEDATNQLEIASSVVEHLESVATTAELRRVYMETLPMTTAFWTSIPLDAGLYRKLKELSQSSAGKALAPVQQRLLSKTLDEFKRHGAELDVDGKARLSAIDEELGRLTAEFSQNVVDATSAWELLLPDASRLAGLPETALAQARDSAAAKGQTGYRLTLQTPSVVAVLTYADDRDLRKTVWLANDARCSGGAHDNIQHIERVLALRQEKAALLGYANFGDLVMADRMAQNARRAIEFIDDLRKRTEQAFAAEQRELDEFIRSQNGGTAFDLQPWDVGYYAEKLRKQRYAIDDELLRVYFPAERMLEAVFETSAELFGIHIEPRQHLSVWDDSVRAYAILDAGGAELGIFYVDLYPRENKNQGAWMHGLITAQPNVGLIAANASPPTSDRPSLLSHRDVETLWHEFGHLLHHCLSKVSVRSLSGTRVAHDFVELPSQIMENFCWEPQMLKRFARHYATLEPIPDELIERLQRARTFRAATGQMRQLGFAWLDLALHANAAPRRPSESVLQFARRVQQPFAPAPLPDGYAMVTTFSHLFARPVGYAAGYYSYKWAEVLDADAYQRFAESGVLSRDVGMAFRREVLEVGDSKDPSAAFEAFRGRPPSSTALMRRLGLIEGQSERPNGV